MPRTLKETLDLATKFEKIAVDIPQPEGFGDEFEKYLALLSRDKGPATVREMVAVVPDSPETVDTLPFGEEDEESPKSFLGPEGKKIRVMDDLPLVVDESAEADDNDAKLGVSGHPWDVDEEEVKKEKAKPKCEACDGEGYKDGKFCKKCQGSGRGKEEKSMSKAAEIMISLAKKHEKKHKLDPKAKVRNRGTVCVPASHAKDHQDHFPINDEDQARNALARVHQYSSAPSWYKGSLKGLQDLVSRKVHSKYPSIGKSEKKKKSSFESATEFLAAYGVADTEELLSIYADVGFGDLADLESLAAKEKSSRDPKAKVRNRGTVVFPAESSSVKDHQDHFPINDEDQARNAWARAHQYSKAPSWYKGSLKSLQDAVKRKVHSKYPSIEFEDKKKKSGLEYLLSKYGDPDFLE